MPFILDTNVISEIQKGSRCNPNVWTWFDETPLDQIFLSVISLGEMRRGVEKKRLTDVAAARVYENWLNHVLIVHRGRILTVTEEIADIWGAFGATGHIPPIDGLIAATAVHFGFTVVTGNEKDSNEWASITSIRSPARNRSMAKYTSIADGFAVTGIDRAERHVFLCLGPDCAPMEEGQRTWDILKRRCGELKLPVMRTKAGCLRVCINGPWLLIYPEGVWYGQVTPERCERILQEHVVQGKPIEEWIERTKPMCGPE